MPHSIRKHLGSKSRIRENRRMVDVLRVQLGLHTLYIQSEEKTEDDRARRARKEKHALPEKEEADTD
jgi:hypothetical protein